MQICIRIFPFITFHSCVFFKRKLGPLLGPFSDLFWALFIAIELLPRCLPNSAGSAPNLAERAWYVGIMVPLSNQGHQNLGYDLTCTYDPKMLKFDKSECVPAMKFFLASMCVTLGAWKRQSGSTTNELWPMSTLSSCVSELTSAGNADIRL